MNKVQPTSPRSRRCCSPPQETCDDGKQQEFGQDAFAFGRIQVRSYILCNALYCSLMRRRAPHHICHRSSQGIRIKSPRFELYEATINEERLLTDDMFGRIKPLSPHCRKSYPSPARVHTANEHTKSLHRKAYRRESSHHVHMIQS